MNLNKRTKTLTDTEAHSWLRSRHGFESADGIQLDGAALGAIYTDGLAKSGTLLAKNTSTGKHVPYDQATSTNGLNVPDGYLKTTVDIRNGSGGFVDSPAAIIRHCKVIKALLPRTTSQTGGPHADAVTALAGRIIHL